MKGNMFYSLTDKSGNNGDFSSDIAKIKEELSNKVDKNEYADIGKYGLVKPHTKTQQGEIINYSGILFDNGEIAVSLKADGGLSKDGLGQIYIKTKQEGGIKSDSDGIYITDKSINQFNLSDSLMNIINNNKMFTVNKLIEAAQWELINLNKDDVILVYNDTHFEYTASNPIITVQGHKIYMDDDMILDPYKTTMLKVTAVGTSSGIYNAYLSVIHTFVTNDDLYQSYSDTPIKIGTWIDGTPIWRWAFDVSKNEISGFEPSDKAVNIVELNIDDVVNNVQNIFVINAFCAAQNNTGKNAVDDQVGHLNNMSAFEFDTNFAPTHTGFYGWIEFATVESNIKGV